MLYREVANIIKDSERRLGSIKSLVFGGTHKNPKRLFALSHETLKYKPIIDDLVQKTQLLTRIRSLHANKWLCRVLLYEFLFGKGIQEKKYKDVFAGHHNLLHTELARLKVKAKVASNEELLLTYQTGTDRACNKTARYVRINTLKASSVVDTIELFKQGFTFISTEGMPYNRYISTVAGLQSKEFTQDIHIPEVLVFASGTVLHDHVLYKEGKIIIQDKASCLPSHVLSTLSLEEDSHCIDCCAAPGNKTSHLAAILRNRGKIFAFDKDSARISSMKKLLHTAGVTCAHVTHGDFLKVKPTSLQYKKVKVAVVDPSCSGSGIVSRLSALTDSEDSCSEDRLAKLSRFQKRILQHAMSFPSLQYAVYSTCSVHEQENEAVVSEVLKACGHMFELVEILPAIPHRGLAEYAHVGRKCVRLSPQQDSTNGFFVACFRRKKYTDVVSGEDTETDIRVNNTNNVEHVGDNKNSETFVKGKDAGIPDTQGKDDGKPMLTAGIDLKNSSDNLVDITESNVKLKLRKNRKRKLDRGKRCEWEHERVAEFGLKNNTVKCKKRVKTTNRDAEMELVNCTGKANKDRIVPAKKVKKQKKHKKRQGHKRPVTAI